MSVIADRPSDEIVKRLMASDAGRKAAAEVEAELLARRRQLVAEIAAAEAEEQKALPALSARREAAEKDLRAAEASVVRARAAFSAVLADLSHSSFEKSRRIAKAEAELRDTAAPMLRELKERLMDLWEQVRHTHITDVQEVGRNWLGFGRLMKRQRAVSTQTSARTIRSAIAECDKAVYEALSAPELAKRIAGIWQTIKMPDHGDPPAEFPEAAE